MRRTSGTTVVRLLLAQELMPVCLLMDVVLLVTSTLLTVGIASSARSLVLLP